MPTLLWLLAGSDNKSKPSNGSTSYIRSFQQSSSSFSRSSFVGSTTHNNSPYKSRLPARTLQRWTGKLRWNDSRYMLNKRTIIGLKSQARVLLLRIGSQLIPSRGRIRRIKVWSTTGRKCQRPKKSQILTRIWINSTVVLSLSLQCWRWKPNNLLWLLFNSRVRLYRSLQGVRKKHRHKNRMINSAYSLYRYRRDRLACPRDKITNHKDSSRAIGLQECRTLLLQNLTTMVNFPQ